MAARKIIQAGDPRLKSTNRIIRDFDSPETKKLIKDLISSMYKADLIGIASNQIGENHMVFVTHPRSTKARKLGKPDSLRIYINPHYNFVSPKMSLIYEGCGSVGEIFGPVLRPEEIEILAMNEKGEKFSLRCNGILARVIQHEMDHLNGIEFLEKVSDYSKIVGKQFYRKNIRKSKVQMENSQVTKIEYSLVK
jgi:peptide deformylase